MGLETREGTENKYYTKVTRVDGKLEKTYVGRLSDPLIQLIIREERLADASATAANVQIDTEIERSRQAELHFVQIARAACSWKVLFRLVSMSSATQGPLPMSKPPNPNLPKLQQLTRVCRLSNKGDAAADAQLRQWVDAAPETFAKATDAIELARESILADLAGDSQETRALLRVRLEQEAEELLEATHDSPLLRHFAETVVLAKMDLVRCQIASLRFSLTIRSIAYWEQTLSRAQQRWIKIEKAYRQAVKEQSKVKCKK